MEEGASTPVENIPFTQQNLADILQKAPRLQPLRRDIKSFCPPEGLTR